MECVRPLETVRDANHRVASGVAAPSRAPLTCHSGWAPMQAKYCLPLALCLSLTLPALSAPQSTGKPGTLSLEHIDVVVLQPLDRAALALEDLGRQSEGLPPRFAIPTEVEITPFNRGTFEAAGSGALLWRLRIQAPGANSLNLGLTRFHLPAGARLTLYSADGRESVRPFTAADNESHGELWTPILPTDDMVLELLVPTLELDQVELELTRIGHGYRGFGPRDQASAEDSGSCNIDVVCPVAAPWSNEIPSVGVISTGGSTFCTGFMVNNTAGDAAPFFMTANHCGISVGNAASLVVYWNFETSTCGGSPDGVLSDFNTGATHLASYATSDFTLLLLDDDPDPAFGVAFAGWNRSGSNEVGAVAIHHPSTDEKRISFEDDPTSITSYLGTSVPGNGTHIRVTDWNLGTTEGGSSGSPLFNPAHEVVGQLHGGYAACGNNLSDWYGRFSVSWVGGGTPSTRLSNWLDPLGTGAVSLSTLGIASLPGSGTITHTGPVGGPFTRQRVKYEIANGSPDPISYSVSLQNKKHFLLDGGLTPVVGVLAPGATVKVALRMASAVKCAKTGVFTEQVLFQDLTNGSSSVRTHVLEVGRATTHSFAMDVDPGWTTEAQWAFGVPAGAGGTAHGLADPSAGATGTSVLGYNLAGDYADDLNESHLTSSALDLTGLSSVEVRFKRWLNVEQPSYDHAYFRISTDGQNWTTVWENTSEVTDGSWSQQVFDISALADDQSTVYLRWTMGSTDGSFRYSGWNIDDVEISAFGASGTGGGSQGHIWPCLNQ